MRFLLKSLSLQWIYSLNKEEIMLAYTYIEHGKFELREKPEPKITDARDAIVRVTLGSICTSDLHIKHGSVRVQYRNNGWTRDGRCRGRGGS